jgi:hypothetical protein
MVNQLSGRIQRLLTEKWAELQTDLQRLSQGAQARPIDGYRIFHPDGTSGQEAKFKLSPMVFNLPERSQQKDVKLFVVAEGCLTLSLNADVLSTRGFATRVAYFRKAGPNRLSHVYGAHYDYSENDFAHPAFHGQLRSFTALGDNVGKHFGGSFDIEDCLGTPLQNVRVPTAQMDFFSLFVQLCADHLVSPRCGPEAQRAFDSVLSRSSFVQGAGARVPNLSNEQALKCYRAWHWYPRGHVDAPPGLPKPLLTKG